MSVSEIITHILQLIAGIGVFLVSCELMSDNLEALSSENLKKIISKVSNNKVMGVGIGAAATAIIQSSSATTVMVIGFVNAGILTLKQASSIIFGGEIGTTITGQIVALGMFGSEGVSAATIFSAFAGIGIFISMSSKNTNGKTIGNVITGFGMLFVGLNAMSSAMKSFAQLESLKLLLASVNNVIVLMILGALLTAIIQSSSAMTSIAITLVVSGLITLEQGIYITLGANVGTCVTGMMAGMSSGINAKRTSLIQLLFNVGGVVLLAIIDACMKMLSNSTISMGILFANMFPNAPQTQLAMFHTIFNIASVVIVLPISDYLVGFTKKLIPDEPIEQIEDNNFYCIDAHMLTTPSIAVGQIKNEIIHMSAIARENFNISMNIVKELDYSKLSQFRRNEEFLNYINHELPKIILQVSKETLSGEDYDYLSSTYRAIVDLERIGDYSENIIEYADCLKNGEHFSAEAVNEITDLQNKANDLFEVTMDEYQKHQNQNVGRIMSYENDIDNITRNMTMNHIKRLEEGNCSTNVSTQYLKLSNDVERIADHLVNINQACYDLSH